MRLSHRKIIFVFVLAVLAAAVVWAVIIPPGLLRWAPAHRTSCYAILRQIEGAKYSWLLDHPDSTNEPVTFTLLTSTNGSLHKIPECPDGGSYILGARHERPRCSIPYHSLEFGKVIVSDAKGNPAPDVRVILTLPNDVREFTTDKDGEVLLTRFRAIESSLWKTGTVTMTSAQTTQSVQLPKPWPIQFVIPAPPTK